MTARKNIPRELKLVLAGIKQDHQQFIELAADSNINWKYFIELGRHHRVFPLLYKFLKANAYSFVPALVQDTLKKLMIEYTFHDEWLRTALKELISILNREQIHYALLKGPMLGETLYGHSALRPSKDIDILVEQKYVEKIIFLLEEKGYVAEEKNSYNLERVFKREHHISLGREKVEIELHWTLMSSKYRVFKSITTEDILTRAVSGKFEGLPVYILKPEDELTYLITHGSTHHWARLRWLNDIVLYLQHYQNLDYNQVIENFKNNGMLHSYFQTLLLIEYLYGNDKVAGILQNEDISFNSRCLYHLTFPYLISTKDMLEYHPLSARYYKKLLYILLMLPNNKERINYIRYQFSANNGETRPNFLKHFQRAFK